ncbi:LysR substrate-binding domain-containing protein [Geothrix fermentans]|uniref:LysR substrate-binding domain-containing protein n=1 Tax=Geothrix fermentans TaxID=44676 RepID=UPI001B7FBE8F|nr:LysR substrate-binding domain-containing protein [Geothrix fermentans]
MALAIAAAMLGAMVRPSDLSLRQLEYLVALADTLGFHRAAERVHVSQPSLSAQIQQIEATLGLRLFERDHRRVLLTPAGEAVVARARRILQEARDLVASAQAWRDPFQGTWRLGVIPTVAPYLLPEVLPALAAAHPDLRLKLREERTPVLLVELGAGRLEAALLAEGTDLGDLARVPLRKDPFLLAAPIHHPVAQKAQVSLRDLEGEPLLLLEDGHCLRDQALAFCGEAGAREVDFRASSLPTLVQMVAAGLGLTLLPGLSIPVEASRAPLALRPFGRPVPGRTLVLAWRRESPLAEALGTFAEDLRRAWP